MSFLLMAKAIKSDIPDCYAKWLFVVLCDHANESDNICWPSISFLANRTQMNVSTIVRKIRWLEEHGFIHKEQGNRVKSNRYTVFPNEVCAESTQLYAPSTSNLSLTSKYNNTRRQNVPDGWTPSHDLQSSINEKMKEEFDHEYEAAKFCDNHQSKGNKFINIDKAYRNWIRNAVEYGTAKKIDGTTVANKKSTQGRPTSNYFNRIHDRLRQDKSDREV